LVTHACHYTNGDELSKWSGKQLTLKKYFCTTDKIFIELFRRFS